MAEKTKLQLTVVSQERELLSEPVDAVTMPAIEGEITVLPGHIPLFSPLQAGVVRYHVGNEEHTIVVSKGFVDIGVDHNVTIIVDTAVHERQVSLERAETAIAAAQKTMENSQDRQELIMAEASLKLALLEQKVARATKRAGI